jgi:hypothetical protein
MQIIGVWKCLNNDWHAQIEIKIKNRLEGGMSYEGRRERSGKGRFYEEMVAGKLGESFRCE